MPGTSKLSSTSGGGGGGGGDGGGGEVSTSKPKKDKSKKDISYYQKKYEYQLSKFYAQSSYEKNLSLPRTFLPLPCSNHFQSYSVPSCERKLFNPARFDRTNGNGENEDIPPGKHIRT